VWCFGSRFVLVARAVRGVIAGLPGLLAVSFHVFAQREPKKERKLAVGIVAPPVCPEFSVIPASLQSEQGYVKRGYRDPKSVKDLP